MAWMLGLILIAIGMAAIVLAMIISIMRAVRAAGGRGGVRGAGVIVIGPIPILVASDREMAKWAVILTVAALAAFTLLVVLAWI